MKIFVTGNGMNGIKWRTNRIKWIDSLRGISCICIFIHHFILFYIPALYSGKLSDSHLWNQIDAKFAHLPFSVIINGNFFVCLFILISSLVVAYGAITASSLKEEGKKIFRRFPKMAIPVFVTSLLAWILNYYCLYRHHELADITGTVYAQNYFTEKSELWQVFYESFYSVWYEGTYTYSPPFWMLKYIFFGTIATFVLSMTVKELGILSTVLICSFVGWQLYQISPYYLNTVAGIVLAKILFSKDKQNIISPSKYVIGCFLIIMGGYLGGFPTGFQDDCWYKYLSMYSYEIVHSIGAMALVYGIILAKPEFLNSGLLSKLGKVSYSFFLLHFIFLCTISCRLFLLFYSRGVGYLLSVIVTGILSLLLLLFLSAIYNRYIQSPSDRIIDEMSQKIFRE